RSTSHIALKVQQNEGDKSWLIVHPILTLASNVSDSTLFYCMCITLFKRCVYKDELSFSKIDFVVVGAPRIFQSEKSFNVRTTQNSWMIYFEEEFLELESSVALSNQPLLLTLWRRHARRITCSNCYLYSHI
ncbi:hypothetical protein C5167_012660, partial [Papaver somniferum]